MGDGLTADGILLIVEGDDNLCGIAKKLGGGIPREDKVPNEEHKVHEAAIIGDNVRKFAHLKRRDGAVVVCIGDVHIRHPDRLKYAGGSPSETAATLLPPPCSIAVR